MKKLDIVKLTKIRDEYKNSNLYKNVHGIILKKLPYDKSLVLFFNDKNVGDYAVIEVYNKDLMVENVKLPKEIIDNLKNSKKINKENVLKKQSFNNLIFNECDRVELIVEDEKYAKYGIHKGETGVIALDGAVNNCVEVDFSGIDENGNYYGDCISVKIEDLKVIK